MSFHAADADVRAVGAAATPTGAVAPELSLEEALAFFDGYDDPALQTPQQQTSQGVNGGASGAFTHIQQQFHHQQQQLHLQQLHQQRQLQYQQFQQLQFQQQQLQHAVMATTTSTDVLMMMDDAVGDADDFMIAGDAFMSSSGMSVDMTGGGVTMSADFGMMASMMQPLHLDDALMLSPSGDNEVVENEITPMQTLLAAPLAPSTVTSKTNVTSAQSKGKAGSADNSPKLRQRAKTKVAATSSSASSPQSSQTQSLAKAAKKVAATTTALVSRAAPSKASTTTSSSSNTSNSNSSSTKRVRRQKEELLYLRTKVVELEERLQQLKRVNGDTNSARGSPAPANSDDADGGAAAQVAKASPASSPTTATSTPTSNAHPSPPNSRKKPREEDTEGTDDEGSPSAISPALLASVWENVAERQYKERLRAEQQNKKLKTMLEGQIKLATSLEKILKKRPNMEVLYPDTEIANATTTSGSSSKPLKSQRVITYEESDEDIFKKQLEGVEKAYLRVDDVMAAADFFHSEERRHDFHVKEFRDEEDGVLMEFMATDTVPFDLPITGNAFWRFMSDVGVKKHCYYEEVRLGLQYDLVASVRRTTDSPLHDNVRQVLHSSEDTSSKKFGVRLSEGGQNVDLRGRHTLRRYIEEDRVVIVWKSLMEPIQLTGAKIRGLRFNDVGWMVAQRSAETNNSNGGGAKTLMKIYGQLCPCLPDESDEDDSGQDEQIGALTDFVINCHESNSALCIQLINDLLVEEEWKTTLPVAL